MHHLATGIFMWNADERRTDRYGAFYAATEAYNGVKPSVPVVYHEPAIAALRDKRVRVVVKVIEGRPSGHLGDLFLGIQPNPLPVGQELELAIGTLRIESDEWTARLFAIEPDEPRELFWIDPRLFYRLHDQTVEIWAEESAAPAHPAFTGRATQDEAIVNPDGKTFQCKTKRGVKGVQIAPKVDCLGDGLFVFSSPDMAVGSRHWLV